MSYRVYPVFLLAGFKGFILFIYHAMLIFFLQLFSI